MAQTNEPTGPTEDVFVCSGCGCLVALAVHVGVCPALSAGSSAEPAAVGPQVIAWLDELDTDELERASIDNAGFDTNVTTAVMAELRRRAAAL